MSPNPTPPSIRDTLFGDLRLHSWTGTGDAIPWSCFAQAQQLLQSNDKPAAIQALQQVINIPDLEARHYLQAWHILRQLGQNPPPNQAKQLLGVVVEVSMPQGLDLLAAYADLSSRYFNYTGGGTIVDTPPPHIKSLVEQLLAVAEPVVHKIGPWDKDRPLPPAVGAVRLNFLTPSGLHFGQGNWDAFSNDPLAAPVLNAATALMTGLVELSDKARKPKTK